MRVHMMSPAVESLELEQTQTSAKGWGPDQAAGWVYARETVQQPQKTARTRGAPGARCRPTQMTTPLHAHEGPFKVPSAPEAKVRFNNNYFNFFKKNLPKPLKKERKRTAPQAHTVLRVHARSHARRTGTPGSRKSLFTCCQYSSREGSAEEVTSLVHNLEFLEDAAHWEHIHVGFGRDRPRCCKNREACGLQSGLLAARACSAGESSCKLKWAAIRRHGFGSWPEAGTRSQCCVANTRTAANVTPAKLPIQSSAASLPSSRPAPPPPPP